MSNHQEPVGVLMLGSVPFESTKEVYTKLCGSLPGRLLAVPDGEVGERFQWVVFQHKKFPVEVRGAIWGGTDLPEPIPTYSLKDVEPTQYDEFALASYAEFVDLRKQGIIPPDVRFQISLPTPFGVVMGMCKPELHAQFMPLYEERLKQSIERIVQNIPHEDLLIQWDLAFETLSLEYDSGRLDNAWFKAYCTPARAGMLDRLSWICQQVPSDIPIAFHLCYGDLGHRHFIEPADTGLMVGFANDIVRDISKTHHIEWMHIPVPRDRNDAAYFEPLKDLALNKARLFLGLVHSNDEAGTRERIKTAQSSCPCKFGVATECGLGRTPKEEVDSILAISKAVTAPLQQPRPSKTAVSDNMVVRVLKASLKYVRRFSILGRRVDAAA